MNAFDSNITSLELQDVCRRIVIMAEMPDIVVNKMKLLCNKPFSRMKELGASYLAFMSFFF